MKKLICLLLCAAMFAISLASCNDNSETSSEAAESSVATSDTQGNSSEVSDKPNIIKEDFGGRTFLIYDTWSEDNYNSEIMPNTFDGDSDDFMTTAVNEALIKRNELTEDYLNIKIEEMHVTSGRVAGVALQDIRTNALSGDLGFHVCAPSIYDCGTLALEGAFVDLNTLSSFDSTNSWWDESFTDTATVNEKLYFVVGDLGLLDKNSTPVVAFNKKMANALGISDLYQTVMDGDWTFDYLYEIAKLVSNDLNNDGVIDYRDEAGYVGQNDDSWNFFYASGEKIIGKSSDGGLRLTMFNERSVQVVESMNKLFRDKKHYVCANDYFDICKDPVKELTGQMFIDGRALFFCENMVFVHKFAAMEDDFGLLPVPKFDKEQENYGAMINAWTGNAFAIPAVLSAEDIYFASVCLDVMCYFSTETVKKEYIERTLKIQKTNDTQSELMLDIIFGNRGTDLGFIYNIGGSESAINSSLPWLLHALMTENEGAFASMYDARKDSAQLALDNLLDLFNS